MGVDRNRALGEILFILNGGWGYVHVNYRDRTFVHGFNGRLRTGHVPKGAVCRIIHTHRAFQRRLKRRGYSCGGDEV